MKAAVMLTLTTFASKKHNIGKATVCTSLSSGSSFQGFKAVFHAEWTARRFTDAMHLLLATEACETICSTLLCGASAAADAASRCCKSISLPHLTVEWATAANAAARCCYSITLACLTWQSLCSSFTSQLAFFMSCLCDGPLKLSLHIALILVPPLCLLLENVFMSPNDWMPLTLRCMVVRLRTPCSSEWTVVQRLICPRTSPPTLQTPRCNVAPPPTVDAPNLEANEEGYV
jgi:hypothetical protein